MRAEVVDQIAAVIEEEVLTFSDVQILVRYRGLAVPSDPAEARRFYLQRLDELIHQKLIAREAEQTPGIVVEPTEVERQIQEFKKRYGTEGDLQDRLRQMQMTREDLYELFKRQLTVMEFIRVRFDPFVIVLPDQIEAYYRETLLPQLQQTRQPVPPLDLVEEQIRQILTVQQVNVELDKWVAAERRKANVQVLLYRDPPRSSNLPRTLQ